MRIFFPFPDENFYVNLVNQKVFHDLHALCGKPLLFPLKQRTASPQKRGNPVDNVDYIMSHKNYVTLVPTIRIMRNQTVTQKKVLPNCIRWSII